MIPGRRVDRWFEKKAVIEALATVPPVLAAAIGALTSLSNPQTEAIGWWLAAGVAWLVAASIAKVLHARAEDRERRRADQHDGLNAALKVLFAVLCAAAGITGYEQQGGRLRLTLHRVVTHGRNGETEELEQLFPYLGAPGDQAGRRFSIRSGIIGRAVRRKNAMVATRENDGHEEFVGELVRDWSYTEAEARRLSPDRYAWMAVPIIGPTGAPLAVVYLDSSEPDFFTDEAQDLILAGCRGIALYTMEAYR